MEYVSKTVIPAYLILMGYKRSHMPIITSQIESKFIFFSGLMNWKRHIAVIVFIDIVVVFNPNLVIFTYIATTDKPI